MAYLLFFSGHAISFPLLWKAIAEECSAPATAERLYVHVLVWYISETRRDETSYLADVFNKKLTKREYRLYFTAEVSM